MNRHGAGKGEGAGGRTRVTHFYSSRLSGEDTSSSNVLIYCPTTRRVSAIIIHTDTYYQDLLHL